jgi:hypothetical protein
MAMSTLLDRRLVEGSSSFFDDQLAILFCLAKVVEICDQIYDDSDATIVSGMLNASFYLPVQRR